MLKNQVNHWWGATGGAPDPGKHLAMVEQDPEMCGATSESNAHHPSFCREIDLLYLPTDCPYARPTSAIDKN